MPPQPLPPKVPSTGNVIGRFIGRFTMRLGGWQLAGAFPDEPKFVLLVAPHTSNWDFIVAVAAKLSIELDGTWIAKDSLFKGPLGWLLRRMGGIPVDRKNPHGVVRQLVDTFAARDRMVFAITPEGTRKRVEHWRSGYWHLAHDARVPIIPVALDYGTRTVFIGPPLITTESLEADERRLRAFFAGVTGRRPENYVK